MEKVEGKRSVLNKIINIVVSVVSYTIIFICLLVSIFALNSKANGGLASINGTAVMTVDTNSMQGTLDKGSLIFVTTVEYDHQQSSFVDKKGRVVTLEENKSICTFKWDINDDGKMEYVTHLYIGMSNNGQYNFQGTYKENEGDILAVQEVPFNYIVGVYNGSKINGVGGVINFVQSGPGFAVTFLLPMFLYVCYTGYKLILAIRENKLELAKEAAKLTEEEKNLERERIRQEIRAELLKESEKSLDE